MRVAGTLTGFNNLMEIFNTYTGTYINASLARKFLMLLKPHLENGYAGFTKHENHHYSFLTPYGRVYCRTGHNLISLEYNEDFKESLRIYTEINDFIDDFLASQE